jgi:SAM-dependent methyltransferase
VNLKYYRNIKRYITHERKPFIELAEKYITPSSRILDVGGGDGEFSRITGRLDTYIFDGNPESVEKLKTKYPNVQCGILPKLPYENNFFSIIHCSHVVEHLQPFQLYEFLQEADRCLANHGYLIISAPLLWARFYDDLSHVRPYPPLVFKKYLSAGSSWVATRPIISSKYLVREEVFRYDYVEDDKYVIYERISLFFIPFILLHKLAFKVKKLFGIRKVEKSGFTIVLQKQV